MLKQQPTKKGRKAYQKPEIKVIELAAEEVLSVGCKTQVSPGVGLPAGNCILARCSGNGS